MSEDLFQVSNRVCLITGASSGIGRMIAQGLAESGAKVMLAARRGNRLQSMVNSLTTQGLEAQSVTCDVVEEVEVESAVKKTLDSYGSLDILVNCAGVTHVAPSTEMSLMDWQKVLDVNLTGTFLCSKHAAKQMITKKRGKIINVSSVYGVSADTSPELPYYASKAGVVGLTRQLALELAPYNVQVNSIAPGFFASEMTKPIIEDADALAYTLSRIPLRRIGAPSEIVGVVQFLASRASDYITGQLMIVDGGWTLW